MAKNPSRSAKRTRPQAMRLVLISAGDEAARASGPPVRIVGSEPRLRGSFRLTDR